MVLWSLVLALLLLAHNAAALTYYVAPGGTDTTPCPQARAAATPRQTINGGVACLQPGDTLEIASGEYPEMLVAGISNLASIRTVQPNTFSIPNGLSALQHTVITAAAGATVWLRPTALYPGGGGVVTTVNPAQYITFAAINLDGGNRHGAAANIKGSDITYTRSELTRSFSQCIASQTDTTGIVISHNHVHHCGLENDTPGIPLRPAMYLCGIGKLVEHNDIHHAPGRGINLSCEQGGIRDAVIRYNRIHDVQVGIGLQGHNNETHDNIIVGAGIGIWQTGGNGGLIRNNTIYDWTPNIADTYGILARSSSGPIVRDNIVVKQRQIASSGFNRYIHTTGTVPQMSGNLFDYRPAGGIQPAFIEADEAALFVDAPGGDFRLAPGSPAIGVGHNGGNLGATIPDAGLILSPITHLTVTIN